MRSVSALNINPADRRARVIVISGGTDGMGRALALARADRGDHVIAIGNDREKGGRLLADAPGHARAGLIEFLPADLSTLAGMQAVVSAIRSRHSAVDALALFANRVSAKRVVTEDGLERTFALYYLARYVLGHGLAPLLRQSASPVIVNVAGVGVQKGAIHWDDLQLERHYGPVAAQLQAGRANDLLGVLHAEQMGGAIPYILYHPGFTKSGDLSQLPMAVRFIIGALSRVFAQPVGKAIAPIHDFIDTPPDLPLSAVDRDRSLPLELATLDPDAARRLGRVTADLLVKLGYAG